MEVKLKILAEGKTLVVKDDTQYLSEGLSLSNYTIDLCESVILIESHETTLTTNNVPKLMIGGFGKSIDIPKDGYVTLHYVILPNKKWIDLKKNTISKILYKTYYYVDNNTVYLYDLINDESISITFLELLTVCCSKNSETNIFCNCAEYMNIWNLYNCYINLCLQLLENRNFSKCYDKNKIDSELIYNRDLVWMTLNVIEYLSELHSEDNPTIMKALQYIEMIHSCKGICSENDSYKLRNYDCGCSKR